MHRNQSLKSVGRLHGIGSVESSRCAAATSGREEILAFRETILVVEDEDFVRKAGNLAGSTSCAESRYEDEIHDLPLGQMSGLVRINDVLLNGFAQDSQGFHSGAIVRNTDGDAISLLFCL